MILEGLGVERGARRLFSGLNQTLQSGEVVALSGANGAGKTSLLRTIAGLIRPAEGKVRFEDDTQEIEPETARTEGLHFLSHQDGLKTSRTAREELDFWSRWMGGSGDLDQAVETFSLSPLMDLDVRKLSAGQRRRLALARLIAAPRTLWLLDEPMAPLDAAMRARFGKVMQAHAESGGIILAAVHDPLPLPTRSLDLGAGR
jgi:heme exporter protein A